MSDPTYMEVKGGGRVLDTLQFKEKEAYAMM